MEKQYGAQRFRIENGRPVGTIPVGTVAYLREHPEMPKKNPWIVEAWLPREVTAASRVGGRWVSKFYARGGHLAQVRSLRDGRVKNVADHLIRFSLEN